jgi:hypothetical protein
MGLYVLLNNKCKQFRGPSNGRKPRGDAIVERDDGYHGVIVATMETTRIIGILANVDCYNSVTW